MTVGGEMVSVRAAAALALHGFGFGPVGDQINAIAADPRGALQADLDRPAAGELKVDFPSSAEAARAVSDFQAERRAEQILAQRAQNQAAAGDPPPSMSDAGSAVAPPQKPAPPPLPQQLLLNEAKARFDAAANAEIGFVERLVWFWSKSFLHFRARSLAWPVPMSGRRSVPTCSAASPICASSRKPSGDAVLSRRRQIDGAEFDRRHQPRQGFERKPRARDT